MIMYLAGNLNKNRNDENTPEQFAGMKREVLTGEIDCLAVHLKSLIRLYMESSSFLDDVEQIISL